MAPVLYREIPKERKRRKRNKRSQRSKKRSNRKRLTNKVTRAQTVMKNSSPDVYG
jgi:hypothetical protein